jgi:hypothetical protein
MSLVVTSCGLWAKGLIKYKEETQPNEQKFLNIESFLILVNNLIQTEASGAYEG